MPAWFSKAIEYWNPEQPPPTTPMRSPDFVKLAESFGVPARRVSPEEVGDALKESFEADGPNVVVVETLLKMFGPTHLGD